MTVRELIALLGTLPPDLPVGYVNDCADHGRYYVTIDRAETEKRQLWQRGGGTTPTKCVVLS